MENLNNNGWKAVGCTNNTDTHNVNTEWIFMSGCFMVS